MKRTLSLLLVLLLVLGLFAGCGGEEAPAEAPPAETPEESPAEGDATPEEPAETPDTKAEGNFIRHNLGASTKTIDPHLNTAVDGAIVLVNMLQGLSTYDVEGNIIPGAAESWDVSEDGMTYTFKLREDGKWSDGQPVVAEDFVYSWQRAVDPVTASEYAYQLYYVENAQKINEGDESVKLEDLGIKAVDEHTLEVKLVAPTPFFLELTAFPTLFPVRKDMIEKDPDQWSLNADTYVSNGPFKLDVWKLNDVIRVVKNDEYWNKDSVKVDGIDFYFIEEQNVAMSAFASGELDYNETISNEQIPVLKESDPGFAIHPYLGTYFYVFNTPQAPFDDARVRKALSLAIDRKSIVENVTLGGQVPATGYVPQGLNLSTGEEFRKVADAASPPYVDPENYEANVEEAKKLLAEAGYPDGEGFPTFEILYNTNESHQAIGEAIQNMWKQALNIDVSLQNEEWAVFLDTRSLGNFEVARHGWIGDYEDPINFLDMWYSTSGNNDCHWDNPEFDKHIDESRLTSGKERDDHMLAAEKLMMDEAVVAPIYYYTKPAQMNPALKDSYLSMLGYVYYENSYFE